MDHLKLYTTSYWVPFPSSEYGGLVIIAANDTEEAANIALESTDDFDREAYDDEVLMTNIYRSIKLIGYSDMYDKPQIVTEFTT